MRDRDPLVSYRLGAVRVGVRATLLALLSLILFRLLPGHGSVPIRPYLLVLVLASAGVALVWVLPWERLFLRGLGLRALYAWSVLDILLVTLAVGVTGGGRSDLFVLYGLTTVFFGAAYPPRSQVALLGFTYAAYLSLLALTGWDVGVGIVFLRCGTLGVLALIVSHLSSELLRLIDSLQRTWKHAERSAALLSTVVGSARRLTLERDPTLESLLDGVIGLGFEGAAMCLFDHEAEVFVISHHRGLPSDVVDHPHPADAGMPGLVRGSGRTQVVDADQAVESGFPLADAGFRALIGSPVWVDGWLAGAIIAGCSDREHITPLEAEAFELLATQAGMALENAQRFEETLHTVERLEELDKLKDNFLATASHEIRTPLTVIVGAGLTLEQRWDQLDDSLRHEMVLALNRNARTLEGLISSLLDFARLGADSADFKKQSCPIGELVQGVAARLEPLFEKRSLEVMVEDGLVVKANPFQMERVLENLLSNASRHTPEGTRVQVSATAEGPWAVVEVADDGPGVSEDEARHLGERFYRGDDINNRGTKGLGLGLALVNEILELHGTTLEITTAPGAGCCFGFRLPLTGWEDMGPSRALGFLAAGEPAQADVT